MRRYRSSPRFKADAARAMAVRDEDIDFSDIPELTDEELARFGEVRVGRKVPVNVRLDGRVVEWLHSKGKGHLTLVNDILVRVMEAERRVASAKVAR
jgi:uncharacterized protein (DUF4415 family)